MRKVILRTLGAFVLAVVTLGLQVIPASAGRIPIPCTGEALVKVLDIPVLQALQAEGAAGNQVTALGYKFDDFATVVPVVPLVAAAAPSAAAALAPKLPAMRAEKFNVGGGGSSVTLSPGGALSAGCRT